MTRIYSAFAAVLLLAHIPNAAPAQSSPGSSNTDTSSTTLPAPRFLPAGPQTVSPLPLGPLAPWGSDGDYSISRVQVTVAQPDERSSEVQMTDPAFELWDPIAVDAGVSIYLLRPYFQTNPAYFSAGGGGTTSPRGGAPDFDWTVSATPAVWLEFTTPSGIGWRGRYFRFDQNASTTSTSISPAAAASTNVYSPIDTYYLLGVGFTAPGNLLQDGVGQDHITAYSRLQLDIIDAEATYAFHPGDWTLLACLGVRYLHTNQDYSISLSNQGSIGGRFVSEYQDVLFNSKPVLRSIGGRFVSEYQEETYGHNFAGAGPSIGLEVKHPLGGRLSVYGNFHGSLLVGNQTENLSYRQQITDPANVLGLSPLTTANIPLSHQELFPTAELELGLEYTRNFGILQSLFRVALVTLNYFDAGNATCNDGNMNLFGLQCTLGFFR